MQFNQLDRKDVLERVKNTRIPSGFIGVIYEPMIAVPVDWPKNIFPAGQGIERKLLGKTGLVVVQYCSSSPVIDDNIRVIAVINALAEKEFNDFTLKLRWCQYLVQVKGFFKVREVKLFLNWNFILRNGWRSRMIGHMFGYFVHWNTGLVTDGATKDPLPLVGSVVFY